METLTALILALFLVEGGGNLHPPDGRYGEVGPLQIRPCVIEDLRRWGYAYTLEDARDFEKAKQICRIYLTHYATRARLGREPTPQDMARIWNGGPDGWRERATLPYWQKVRWELFRIQESERLKARFQLPR